MEPEIILNRPNIKQHILFALGEPVIKVELDDSTLDYCIDTAKEKVYYYYAARNKEVRDVNAIINMLVQDGAVAFAVAMLGRTSNSHNTGETLRQSGQKLIDRWWDTLYKTFFYEQKMYQKVLLALLKNSNISPNDAVRIAKNIMNQV